MGYQNPAAGAARESTQAAAVDDIADPTGDAETKVNELLGALRDAGVIAPSS